jgi:hypothetical protein
MIQARESNHTPSPASRVDGGRGPQPLVVPLDLGVDLTCEAHPVLARGAIPHGCLVSVGRHAPRQRGAVRQVGPPSPLSEISEPS